MSRAKHSFRTIRFTCQGSRGAAQGVFPLSIRAHTHGFLRKEQGMSERWHRRDPEARKNSMIACEK
jgi:hypothetical protein